MNIEMAVKVRDFLADPKNAKTFNMEGFATETKCGTKFCIAGHTVLVSGGSYVGCDLVDWFDADGNEISVQDHARDLLGLTQYQASLLFYGWFGSLEQHKHLGDITTKDAVKELNRLIRLERADQADLERESNVSR